MGTIPLVASAICLLVIASCADGVSPDGLPEGPSFIVIMTDDQATQSIEHMPALQRRMIDQGLVLENFFVTTSLCCPSRVSFLTGQYAHNHGVWSNLGPEGGWPKMRELGLEEQTFVVSLDEAGYRTGLFGKYVNAYPVRAGDGNYVPPGWDKWLANAGGYFAPFVDEAGSRVSFGPDGDPAAYTPDVVLRHSLAFVRDAGRDPFFLWVSFFTPHAWGGDNSPPIRLPRHQGLFSDLPYPETPALDEDDVSDKPPRVASEVPLSAETRTRFTSLYQAKVESLQLVDEAIDSIFTVLEAEGLLDDTYVVFMSDNGFHLGEHRLRAGKNTLYETDTRVPFVVVGPGIPGGRRAAALAANVDLAPTFLELAGVSSPLESDGTSLVDLWLEGTEPARSQLLLEVANLGRISGLRRDGSIYVEWPDGSLEYYDLQADPHQLQNLADSLPSASLESMRTDLARLRNCRGGGC